MYNERSSYSLVFLISRTRPKKNGECPIFLKININGDKTRFPGQGVAPNQKFFLFEEYIEASGNAFEGRYRDAGIQGATYPYEAKVFLWLVNEQES